MTKLKLRLELAQTATDIRERIITTALDVGKALISAKRDCRHGEWTPFLRAAELNERSARRLMRYARIVEKEYPGYDNPSDLPSVTALLDEHSESKTDTSVRFDALVLERDTLESESASLIDEKESLELKLRLLKMPKDERETEMTRLSQEADDLLEMTKNAALELTAENIGLEAEAARLEELLRIAKLEKEE